MTDPAPRNPSDEVWPLLLGLEDRLRMATQGVATLEREHWHDAEHDAMWHLVPLNPKSLQVTWMEWGDGLILHAARENPRWELGRTAQDVQFIEDVALAVIAGRVTETVAPARSRVDITLADGRVVHQTGLVGCLLPFLPLPGWRRWGQVTHYEPYA